jgi:hypothetical protein
LGQTESTSKETPKEVEMRVVSRVNTASDFHFLFEKGKLGVFRIVLERTEMEPNEGALAKQTQRNEIEGNRHRWAK